MFHLKYVYVCIYILSLLKQVVTAVNDVEKLAEDLLPIAARRMMAYLSKSPDLLEEVSRISPTLTKYLESLVSYKIYFDFITFYY